MTKRYFIRLSYSGANYSGWQVQPNAETVQSVIQNNLTKLNKNIPVKIMGCGRTDAGVHAKDFFAHMDFEEIADINHFIYKLNHMLPHDIAIHAIALMDQNSHTRFDATSRTYQYSFHFDKMPFLNSTSLLISKSIDIQKMKAGAKILLNYNDFEAFSRVNTSVNNFVCNLSQICFEEVNNVLVFKITANRFLRNMVRAIVGTLLELGEGRINLQEFIEIIESKDRAKAGKSASAKGLMLTQVCYPYPVL